MYPDSTLKISITTTIVLFRTFLGTTLLNNNIYMEKSIRFRVKNLNIKHKCVKKPHCWERLKETTYCPKQVQNSWWWSITKCSSHEKNANLLILVPGMCANFAWCYHCGEVHWYCKTTRKLQGGHGHSELCFLLTLIILWLHSKF